MAENKNLDELNMLQNDGKIDSTQARQEDRKDVEAVARGKKTIEDAPQAVTVELLKEYSNQNKVFAKLEAHCDQDGVDIYAYFMRCFKDNETVRVSDILDDIAKRIPTLIDVINDDKNNNLFIDGNGNIDIAGAIKKARDNGRELPSYIQAIAQDAGKEEKNNEKIPESVMEFLTQKDSNFFREIGQNLSNEIDKAFKEDLKDYLNDSQEQEVDGETVVTNKNYSREDNILVNQFYRMREIIRNVDEMTDAEKEKYIVQLMVLYNKCKTMDLSNSKIENIDRFRQTTMARLAEAFSAATRGRKIEDIDIKDDAELAEYLAKEFDFDLTADDIKNVREDIVKEIDKKASELTDKALQLLDNVHNESVENQYDKILAYNVYLKLEQYGEDYNAKYHPEFSSYKSENFRLKSVQDTLEENGVNYEDQSDKLFGENNQIGVYIQILKRENFRKRLDDLESGKTKATSVVPLSDEYFEYPVFLAAIDIINSNGKYKSDKDTEMRERAFNFLEKNFPSLVRGKERKIDYERLFQSAVKKYGLIPDNVKNYKELVAYAQDSTENTLRVDMSRAIKNDAKNIDMSDAHSCSLDDFNRILTSEETAREVRAKSITNKKIMIDYLAVDDLEKNFKELYEVRHNKDFNSVQLIKLIETSLILSDHFQSTYKDKMMNPEYCDIAKTVLMEYIPDAFSSTGKMGSPQSNDKIVEFFNKHGSKLIFPPGGHIGHALMDSRKKMLERHVEENAIKYNPEELKRRQDEINKKKEIASKKISVDYDLKILKYIKLLREQDKEKINSGKFDNLEKIISEKLKRKIAEDSQFAEIVAEVEKAPQDDVLAGQFARTTRRMAASDIVTKIKNAHSDNSPLSEDELKEVFDICAGLRNDYQNEDMDIIPYRKLMSQISVNILKKNGFNIIEKSKINDDAFLEAYNKLFGTQITNIEELCERKSAELVGRGIEQSVVELNNGKKGITDTLILNQIVTEDFKPKQKIAEYRKEKTTLDIKETIFLSDRIQSKIQIGFKRPLTKEEEMEQVKDLVILAKMIKDGENTKKFSESYYTEFRKINEKLSVLVKNQLITRFPEMFSTETGHLNAARINSLYLKYLEENGVDLPKDIKTREGFLLTETLEMKKQIRESFSKEERSQPLSKQLENALGKLNESLRGFEDIKTDETYINIGCVVKNMQDKTGVKHLSGGTFNHLQEENPDLYKKVIRLSSKERIDDDCMYRLSLVTAGDSLKPYTDLVLQKRYQSVDGKIDLDIKDKENIILFAMGAITSFKNLKEAPPQSEREASTNARELLKKAFPDSVKDGLLDETVILQEYNNIRRHYNHTDITMEALKGAALKKVFMETCKDISKNRTINSRYNEILKKYSVVRDKDKGSASPVSKEEMDRIMEVRGEVIVVGEEKKKIESLINGDEVSHMFETSAVEIGEGEPKKIEQQSVSTTTKTLQAEEMEVNSETFGRNLPAEQKTKGFLGNLFDNIKKRIGEGLKTVKDKIFGTNNTGTTDNNATGTTSGGGIVQDETEKPAQQVVQPNNDWIQTATISVEDAHKKLNESKGERNVDKSDGPSL